MAVRYEDVIARYSIAFVGDIVNNAIIHHDISELEISIHG